MLEQNTVTVFSTNAIKNVKMNPYNQIVKPNLSFAQDSGGPI